MQNINFIVNLNSLRAFAAINVVIFHILGTSSAYGFAPEKFIFLGDWGSSGVHLFFVLSGFVMLHTQLRAKQTMFLFLKSRLIRIVPIYWLLTSVTIASFALLPETAFNGKAPSSSEVLESLFFVSLVISDKWPVLAVGWTLELEMLFYLVFGLALIFSRWSISIFIVSLLLTIIAVITSNLIILEFIFGMFAALCFQHFRLQPQTGLILAILGLMLLLSSINNAVDAFLPRVIYWGLPSTLIILGLAYSKPYSQHLLNILGDSSYSLYLVHVLAISVFYKILSQLPNDISHELLALFCLLTSILCGVCLWFFVERPLTKFIKSLL